MYLVGKTTLNPMQMEEFGTQTKTENLDVIFINANFPEKGKMSLMCSDIYSFVFIVLLMSTFPQ